MSKLYFIVLVGLISFQSSAAPLLNSVQVALDMCKDKKIVYIGVGSRSEDSEQWCPSYMRTIMDTYPDTTICLNFDADWGNSQAIPEKYAWYKQYAERCFFVSKYLLTQADEDALIACFDEILKNGGVVLIGNFAVGVIVPLSVVSAYNAMIARGHKNIMFVAATAGIEKLQHCIVWRGTPFDLYDEDILFFRMHMRNELIRQCCEKNVECSSANILDMYTGYCMEPKGNFLVSHPRFQLNLTSRMYRSGSGGEIVSNDPRIWKFIPEPIPTYAQVRDDAFSKTIHAFGCSGAQYQKGAVNVVQSEGRYSIESLQFERSDDIFQVAQNEMPNECRIEHAVLQDALQGAKGILSVQQLAEKLSILCSAIR